RDLCAARLHRVWEYEDGIDAAHLGEYRDRDWASRRRIKECATRLQRSCESNCACRRMSNERHTQRRLSSVNQGKNALGHVTVARSFLYNARGHLRCPRVSRMCLYNYRISSGERRCCITSTYRECQWKVAGTEDDYRTERNQHSAQIRFRWRTRGIRLIDARIHPRAFADQCGKHAKLGGGASSFGDQPILGKRSFGL